MILSQRFFQMFRSKLDELRQIQNPPREGFSQTLLISIVQITIYESQLVREAAARCAESK
jgi:hypothetical protein